jgi:hypothetical protein
VGAETTMMSYIIVIVASDSNLPFLADEEIKHRLKIFCEEELHLEILDIPSIKDGIMVSSRHIK